MQSQKWIGLLAALILISGCGDSSADFGHVEEMAVTGVASAPAAKSRMSADSAASLLVPNGGAQPAQQYLAYTHSAEVQVDADELAVVFERVRNWCLTDTRYHCQVMDSAVQTDRYLYGRVQMRLLAEGVEAAIENAAAFAELVSRSTHAEDLGAAIVDTEKRLSMLKDYRSKLEALDSRSDNNIDALVKIASELSRVQADIEAAEGRFARLLQRVETDVLTVSFSAEAAPPLLEPIATALANFGHSLSKAAAGLITATAYFLPWLLAVAVLVWIVVFLWRRRH